jgi:hypothetical protein
LPPAPPGGSPSTSPTLVVTAVGPAANTPQEARHQCLQLRWWPLLDLPPALPRGFAISVSNSSGGRCRTYHQYPPGARHRRLQLRWRLLPDLPTAPSGARHRCVAKLGTCRQNFSGDTYQGGHRGKHYHYKQAIWRKNGGKSLARKNSDPYDARTRES